MQKKLTGKYVSLRLAYVLCRGRHKIQSQSMVSSRAATLLPQPLSVTSRQPAP